MLKNVYKNNCVEAGTDEAGRGCLAGPVFAAAVVFPPNYSNDLLRDSKKLSHDQRNALYDIIKQEALAFGISSVGPERIDSINILNASIEAMHLSLDKLDLSIDHIIVDGNRFKPYNSIPFECIIKGDDKFYSIAAASILAKVERDRYMEEQGQEHPHYGWASNKGYPTIQHRQAIREHGPCSLHRKSFKLLPDAEQKELF